MLSTILVPLDGSALAEQALPFAERVAQAAQARVILTRVVPALSGAETSIEAGIAYAAREYLEEIAVGLRRAGITVRVTVPEGDAAAQTVSAVAAPVASMQYASAGVLTWIACQCRFSTSTVDLLRPEFIE